ncbi:hypothetical protein AB0C76_22665 [Kitasatospora sp. NPDC048722]|uniref:hypothetical protein n=1 Tax=Kitasatospora sp. NPDC048722 TaxID=3155639 RepID=UPI0033CE0626
MGALNHPGTARILLGFALLLAIFVVAIGALAVLRMPHHPADEPPDPAHRHAPTP